MTTLPHRQLKPTSYINMTSHTRIFEIWCLLQINYRLDKMSTTMLSCTPLCNRCGHILLKVSASETNVKTFLNPNQNYS